MIAVIQRVKKGSVTIEGKLFSSIEAGQVILLGIFQEDNEDDVKKIADKIVNLRIMSDEDGKMNRSILDTKGEILLVSQFTLCADLAFGRRPSFIKAKEPTGAEKLYNLFIERLKENGIGVKTGKFGNYMDVEIVNDGPVTIIINSNKK